MTDSSAPASRTESQTASGSSLAETTTQAEPRRRKTGGATPKPTDTGVHVARIMAVANQKGGVGKSTTAVSLGAALAEAGHTVLVVDLDPQGNASTGLGIRHEAREVTVYDVLAAEADVRRAIVPTPVENLFSVPSTIDLAGAEIELVSQFSRELRLKRALEPLHRGAFDFILLDCPPSLGLLTINALAAAEELIVPIQCEYYALEGLGQLLRNVRLVQQNVNPELRLAGIVMTMFDPRTKLSEQVVDEVRKYFGELVYRTIIPRTVRLSEAPGFGQPITVYDPRSRGAECYRELAVEVASRPPAEGPMPVFDEMPTVVVEPVAPSPARSAPRPLREAAGEEASSDVLENAGSLDPEMSGGPEEGSQNPEDGAEALQEGAEPIPQPMVEVDVSRGPTSAPTAEDLPETVTGPEAAPEPEPQASPGSEASPEPEPEPEPELESGGPPEAPQEHVVVIDAYDLDPEALVEGEGAEEGSGSESEAGPKRWSLFRRGGKR